MDDTKTLAPRWAVIAAWAVPLCVLPSALWRLTLVADGRVPFAEEGWYLVLLSVLSMALALLTLGLVQRWGDWFPPRLVAVAATAGATLLIAVCLYAAANAAFHVVDQGPVLVGDENAVRPEPGAEVIAFYLPLALWGPLVLAVARDFRRRHAS